MIAYFSIRCISSLHREHINRGRLEVVAELCDTVALVCCKHFLHYQCLFPRQFPTSLPRKTSMPRNSKMRCYRSIVCVAFLIVLGGFVCSLALKCDVIALVCCKHFLHREYLFFHKLTK